MTEDFLGQIQAGLDKPLASQDTVLKDKNEPTHPVQVRESTYNNLKRIAFERDIKLVDLIESLLQYALSNKEFEPKE